MRNLLSAMRTHKVATASGGVLAIIVLAAILAPLITWHDPLATDVRSRLLPPFWMDGGSFTHPLGTDSVGRDLYSRIVYGLRSSLFIGVTAVALGGVVGVVAGVLSAYYDGRATSFVFGRFADVQQSIPFVVLALAIAAAVGASFRNLIIILGLGSWLFYYRIVRSEVLPLREEPFILAVRTLGASDRRILVRHVMPNILPSILVTITLFVPTMIMFSAALSFLGLGVQAPQAELGLMISEGRGFIETAWWLSVFPGVALGVIVLAMNSLGDWLRDHLDPTQRQARSR